jgi:uncharacterized membrane protein YqiK
MIKTIKNRAEFMKKHDRKGLTYDQILDQEVKNYNENDVPRSIGMTPLEADKKENTAAVKLRLETKRVNRNPRPKLKKGDEVRIYRKKGTFDKGFAPQYTEKTYIIKKVIQSPLNKQTKYIIDMGGDSDKGFLHYKTSGFTRNELQLVKESEGVEEDEEEEDELAKKKEAKAKAKAEAVEKAAKRKAEAEAKAAKRKAEAEAKAQAKIEAEAKRKAAAKTKAKK